MLVSSLKVAPRKVQANNNSLNIQIYGEENDYPQRIKEIVDASGTGKSCVEKYNQFINGKGFADNLLSKKIINESGQTSDYILKQICKDYALYYGFAIHVNYNALYQITEINHVPFEHVRFGKLDKGGNFDNVAIHPDWGRRLTSLRKFDKDDIDYIDLFNPNPEVIDAQVARDKGWGNYKGQVLYVSEAGDKIYPLAKFDSVATEMNTEEGIINLKNRETRNGFRVGSIIVEMLNEDQSEEQSTDLENHLLQFQGDMNAAKLMVFQAKSKEEIPHIIPLETGNSSKEFEYTEKSLQANIGKLFSQPPILRADDVGGNFGADAIRNAYNYYNSVTEGDRIYISQSINKLFVLYTGDQQINTEIEPLAYTYTSIDLSSIPSELFSVLTVNEKRELLGLMPLDEGNLNSLENANYS